MLRLKIIFVKTFRFSVLFSVLFLLFAFFILFYFSCAYFMCGCLRFFRAQIAQESPLITTSFLR
ncbi:hypothetical protein CG392_02745 [Gardnerella vaginalis]|nr:hypothetical protein CG392_02745 [Gardnerella vaginalis]